MTETAAGHAAFITVYVRFDKPVARLVSTGVQNGPKDILVALRAGHDRVPAFCGIDVGTQGVRAIIVDERGKRLGDGRTSIKSGVRDGVRHEQDPSDWWRAMVGAVRSAVALVGPEVEVEAVALDATSGTVLVEGRDGASRGMALMYDDARAVEPAVRAQEVGAGLWSSLGYRMQTSWSLPKVMWLLEQDAVGAGDRVVHQSDHLLRRLTGTSVATDTSHGLKTGVDLRDGVWPVDLLAELGVAAGTLPDLVWPGTTIGHVGAEGAQATGLRGGTPVRAGMTDGCAAQIAARALRPGSWSSALGTTLVIKGSTPSLLHDPRGSVYCHRSPDGGWLPGGASSTGAGIIAREFPDHDAAALDALTAAARGLVPMAGVTYALAGTGERFPFVAPGAYGFASERVHTEPGRFAALCQSIGYVERLAYDVLGALGADVSGPVSLSGGATANTWWNQLRTDILGRPTLLPASVQGATGMAILAAAPAGELAVTAERMVSISAEFQPDESSGRALWPGYERLVDELVDRSWLSADLAGRALARSAGRR